MPPGVGPAAPPLAHALRSPPPPARRRYAVAEGGVVVVAADGTVVVVVDPVVVGGAWYTPITTLTVEPLLTLLFGPGALALHDPVPATAGRRSWW